MGKSLYVFKMYILSHLYTRLTAGQERGITRLTLFIIALYGKYYLQSSHSSSALRLYLTLFYDLCIFFKKDHEIATRFLTSFRRHLWYHMPEFAVLSLFDEKLHIDNKQLSFTKHAIRISARQTRFWKSKHSFETRWKTVSSWFKSLKTLGFCLNMQHFTLWKREWVAFFPS